MSITDIPMDSPPTLRGVGVLRYPPGHTPMPDGTVVDNRDLAADIAATLQSGSVLVLPNMRDDTGEYEWDFRVEMRPYEEVVIQRSDEAVPSVSGPK